MDKNQIICNSIFSLGCSILFFIKLSPVCANPSLTYGTKIEGGKVACLKADGGIENLLVTDTDISPGITWGGQGQAIGAAAQSDTDGMGNTKAIVATLGTDSSYAALLCTQYEVDEDGKIPCATGATCYKDWFLPARTQLDCVHEHKKAIGNFASDFYWTSTEFSGYPAYTSWDKFFGDGPHEYSSVDDSNRVRCVRVFNP